MTRTEELRESILKIQAAVCDSIECPDGEDPCPECRTGQILKLLADQVAFVVEKELPEIPADFAEGIENARERLTWEHCQTAMYKAGWCYVELVVEPAEVKDAKED